MALSNIQRARIVLDLLKDGEVANQAAYGSVDLAPAATALKYAAAIYPRAAGPLAPGAVPTNDQLAAALLKALRLALRDAALQSRVPAAAETAANNEQSTVLSETQLELGE